MVSLVLTISFWSFWSFRWFRFGRFGSSARFGGFVLVVSVFRFGRFDRFARFGCFGRFVLVVSVVSVVSFRSFRFVVLGFSTCPARIIPDLPSRASLTDALERLSWKILLHRRAEHRAIFVHKSFNNLFS